MLSINGDLGYTSTELGSSDKLSYFGIAGGIGLKAGYGIFESGIIYTGLELQERELVVLDAGYDEVKFKWQEHFTQKYLEIPLAYRFLFWSMYADLGGFYSLRVGDMKYKETGHYTGSGTISEQYTNDDYGYFLGIGTLIPVGENWIDIGLKMKAGYPWVVDDGSTYQLRCTSLGLTVGYTAFF